MSKPLAERYIHYDATDAAPRQLLRPRDIGECAFKLEQVTSSVVKRFGAMFGEHIEPTAMEREFIDKAADFIHETTGLPVDCEIGKFAEIGQLPFDAAYLPSLHLVALLDKLGGNGSEYGDKMELGSIFVHELMHSTSVDTAKVVGIYAGNNNYAIKTLQPHHSIEITPTFASENFFEEGLAEEIASRWRMHFDSRLRYRETELMTNKRRRSDLPVRMYQTPCPIDETTCDSERGHSYAAHCAFGIQIMSEYTGVDLIELLIQARKPETQAAASQKIKDTVDSIEPGLYDVLTGADYTVEDFEDTVEIIKQAIANHAHMNYSSESRHITN